MTVTNPTPSQVQQAFRTDAPRILKAIETRVLALPGDPQDTEPIVTAAIKVLYERGLRVDTDAFDRALDTALAQAFADVAEPTEDQLRALQLEEEDDPTLDLFLT